MTAPHDSPAPPAGRQRLLVTYSILVGLTPLIPIPFADDLAKNYFRRRLVRALAEARRVDLGAAEVETLTAEREGGCLGGCLAQAILYPLKVVFRKVFYFLEWKRAIDLTSRTYHYGYLIDYAMGAGLLPASPAGRSAQEIREAVERVCREAPIKPVESAVGATFRRSKEVLAAAARLIERSYQRAPSPGGRREKVVRAVEASEEEERREVSGVAERLQSTLEKIPETHFENLRARLDAHLARSAAEDRAGRPS